MSGLLSYLRAPAGAGAIRSGRILLRPPQRADYGQWAALRRQSRDFLQPWEPLWAEDELEPAAFRRRLRACARETAAGRGWPLFIFGAESGELLGGVTLSNIRRGVAQTATLGYWIGAPYARQGYMSEAVRALVRHAFGPLGLHRVEAACVPENTASRRLLEGCGFIREGKARAYLRINGRWRDHLLYAILRDDVENSG